MATRTLATERKEASKQDKMNFSLLDLPNAILGIFGLRTEAELPYESLLEDDDFSVRNFLPHVEIRNEEVGTREEATDRSFPRLYNYINGENWDQEKFSMTTPVLQRTTGEHRWSTSFFLKGKVEDLPLPKSSAVKLYSVTSETMAVLRFSGRPTDELTLKQIARLQNWISERDLTVVGEPMIAQFDQPFSIPFLRRNEIHIPIETL